ncbi:MAG: glycosyltransferase [bacterium]|nr:glycosyltransferase [bacterium]
MKVCAITKKFPKEDTVNFLGFEKFENMAGDFIFLPARINFKALEADEFRGKKIVYYELEEPNRFFSKDQKFRRDDFGDDNFYKILSACPHTTEWLNKRQGNNKRTHVFVPFDEDNIPPVTEKIYDVIYVGGIHSSQMLNTVRTIKKFNHKYVSLSEALTYKLWRNTKIARKILSYLPKKKNRYITDQNITYREKLKLTSQSKITLVHTLLNANAKHVSNIQKTEGWRGNKAFACIPEKSLLNTIGNYLFQREYPVPQQKGRIFEAVFCRSLLLCQKDQFREIERYFTPDKEFVYYEEGCLEEKIKEILSDWPKYSAVIENAFRRAQSEYTTRNFVEKYLKNVG